MQFFHLNSTIVHVLERKKEKERKRVGKQEELKIEPFPWFSLWVLISFLMIFVLKKKQKKKRLFSWREQRYQLANVENEIEQKVRTEIGRETPTKVEFNCSFANSPNQWWCASYGRYGIERSFSFWLLGMMVEVEGVKRRGNKRSHKEFSHENVSESEINIEKNNPVQITCIVDLREGKYMFGQVPEDQTLSPTSVFQQSVQPQWTPYGPRVNKVLTREKREWRRERNKNLTKKRRSERRKRSKRKSSRHYRAIGWLIC